MRGMSQPNSIYYSLTLHGLKNRKLAMRPLDEPDGQ